MIIFKQAERPANGQKSPVWAEIKNVPSLF